jgi:hypothetical protein
MMDPHVLQRSASIFRWDVLDPVKTFLAKSFPTKETLVPTMFKWWITYNLKPLYSRISFFFYVCPLNTRPK